MLEDALLKGISFFFPLSPFCLIVIPDTLTDMVNQMTEKVGLVHGLPYVADRQGFAATLEQVSIVVMCHILTVTSLIYQKPESSLSVRVGMSFPKLAVIKSVLTCWHPQDGSSSFLSFFLS